MASDLKGQITIRPATASDVAAVYGAPPPRTMRAYAAELEGETIAVAGVYYYPEQVVAFSAIKPEHAHHKLGLAKGAVKVLAMLKKINKPILAIAEPDIPTSAEFLERCGFEYVKTNSQGKVYIWRKH